MHRLRGILISALFGLAVFGFLRPAHAVLTLSLESGASSVLITDNDAVDLSPLTGLIVFSGPVGVFSVNVTTGITDSANPTPDVVMDLNSLNVSTAAGVLTVALTDTELSAPSTGEVTVLSGIGGNTTNSSISYLLLVNGTEIFSGGPLGGLAFTQTNSGTATVGTIPYTMSLVTVTTARGWSITSYDWQVVPEPSTMLLLGIGLIGLAAWSRGRIRSGS